MIIGVTESGRMDYKKLVLFIVLTFGISWAFWLPMALVTGQQRLLLIFGTFGPTIAALIITVRYGGTPALRSLLGRLLDWRVNARWYLFSFLGPVVILLAAIGLHMLLGGDDLVFNDPRQLYLVIPVFLYVLFFSVAGEEIGWRGFALPELLKTQRGVVASLMLGLVWAAWHLPLFWISGDFHRDLPILLFTLQILGLSFLYTWLWINTNGSLIIAHLFHAASNTATGLLPVLPMDTGGSLRPLWLAVGLLWILVLVIVLLNPAAMLRQSPADGTVRPKDQTAAKETHQWG